MGFGVPVVVVLSKLTEQNIKVEGKVHPCTGSKVL